jgi:hypothetical protein
MYDSRAELGQLTWDPSLARILGPDVPSDDFYQPTLRHTATLRQLVKSSPDRISHGRRSFITRVLNILHPVSAKTDVPDVGSALLSTNIM